MAIQPGLCRTWSETLKTGFLVSLLILCFFQNADDIPEISRDDWIAAVETTQKSLTDKEVDFYEELNTKKAMFNFR